ncbi:MAG TPA: DUF2089 family protein [Terracidiphilus sp.]
MATQISQRLAARRAHPLTRLEEDDLDFIVQFVLASGSLKDMAQVYGVSYPTIRGTLDRVIANLRQKLNTGGPDEMTELLAGLVERGELKPAQAKRIRDMHRGVMEELQERSYSGDWNRDSGNS